jgi:hypothetical protein
LLLVSEALPAAKRRSWNSSSWRMALLGRLMGEGKPWRGRGQGAQGSIGGC